MQTENDPPVAGKADQAGNLMLVGTVHHDPDGFKRLSCLLRSLAPDLMLIELSPFGWSFRRKNQRRLCRILTSNLREIARDQSLSYRTVAKHPQIRAISKQITLPFEYRASLSYARFSQSKLLLVDYSPFSRECIQSWPELISKQNLIELLSLPEEERSSISAQYKLAALRIARHESATFELKPRDAETTAQWITRERFMAARIKTALAKFSPRQGVYIGGWWHLTEGGKIPTLRTLLDIPSAQCRLLDQPIAHRSIQGGQKIPTRLIFPKDSVT